MARNGTKATPHARERFIEALRMTANVTRSAEAADVDRRTVYKWRDEDEAFAEAWDAAVAEACDRLEAEAWRRATEGYQRPIYYRGEQVGTELSYSDRLMELLLKSHKPEKYRDRVEQTQTITHRVSDEPIEPDVDGWKNKHASGKRSSPHGGSVNGSD